MPRAAVCLILSIAALAAAFPAGAQQALRDSMFAVERTEDIVYASLPAGQPPVGVALRLDLYEPLGDAPVPRPGCVIVHGAGSYRQRPLLVRLAAAMAGRGYVAMSIDYRDTVAHPVVSPEFAPYHAALVDSFPTSPDLDVWAANTEDVTTAVRWLIAHSDSLAVDAERIVIGGISRGATLSLNVAYVIDDYGVVLDPPLSAVWEQAGTLASYVDHIEAGETPGIVIHGTADQVVHFELGVLIRDRLHHVGVPYDFYAVEGAGHFIDLFAVRPGEGLSPFQRIVQFFYFFVGPPLPVELTGQALEPGAGRVVIRWSVSPDSDPVAFEVWRSTVAHDGDRPGGTGDPRADRFERLVTGPLLPVVRGGRRYRYEDRTVEAGARYRYRLQATDRAGAVTTYELGRVTVPSAAGVDPALSFVSPRPVGAGVRVDLELPVAARVALRVRDVTGRTVRLLHDGHLDAGPHAILWDGRDLRGRPSAAGVYFLELHAGARALTRKLVLAP